MKPEEHFEMRKMIAAWRPECAEELRVIIINLKEKIEEMNCILSVLEPVYSFQVSLRLEEMGE